MCQRLIILFLGEHANSRAAKATTVLEQAFSGARYYLSNSSASQIAGVPYACRRAPAPTGIGDIAASCPLHSAKLECKSEPPICEVAAR